MRNEIDRLSSRVFHEQSNRHSRGESVVTEERTLSVGKAPAVSILSERDSRCLFLPTSSFVHGGRFSLGWSLIYARRCNFSMFRPRSRSMALTKEMCLFTHCRRHLKARARACACRSPTSVASMRQLHHRRHRCNWECVAMLRALVASARPCSACCS